MEREFMLSRSCRLCFRGVTLEELQEYANKKYPNADVLFIWEYTVHPKRGPYKDYYLVSTRRCGKWINEKWVERQ